MKLEFLDDISENVHINGIETDLLVRLFDFDKLQANKFKQAIQLTIIENNQSLDLVKLKFIESLNCNLTLRIADGDTGITTGDNTNFYCDLTISAYKNMISLLEPFCIKGSTGYKWLYDIDTPIEFLFSPDAKW